MRLARVIMQGILENPNAPVKIRFRLCRSVDLGHARRKRLLLKFLNLEMEMQQVLVSWILVQEVLACSERRGEITGFDGAIRLLKSGVDALAFAPNMAIDVLVSSPIWVGHFGTSLFQFPKV